MKKEAEKKQHGIRNYFHRLTFAGSKEQVEEEKPAEEPMLEKKGSAEKKLILRFKRSHA
jgi:hypothetical protein